MGIAPSCQRRIEGSGFVISPQHVLTNAHVVAGVTEGQTVTTRLGAQFRATVVLFDPERDLAVLYVPGLTARTLHFAGPANLGDEAIVAGYPRDHAFTAVPARVGDDQLAQAPDIYQSKEVTRQIYSIRANVEPGNSGGPLLAPGRPGGRRRLRRGRRREGHRVRADRVRGESDAARGGHRRPRRLHPGAATSTGP